MMRIYFSFFLCLFAINTFAQDYYTDWINFNATEETNDSVRLEQIQAIVESKFQTFKDNGMLQKSPDDFTSLNTKFINDIRYETFNWQRDLNRKEDDYFDALNDYYAHLRSIQEFRFKLTEAENEIE